jgi:hypothetical protein
MKLFKNFLILASFFCLSAGVYYGGAKFHVPWYGANDYSEYYKIAADPFDNTAMSPWAYRVITPITASYIEKSGLYYDSLKTPYKDNYLVYDKDYYRPSLLSALIFTNYIFLSLAAFFTYKSFSAIVGENNLTDKVIAVIAPSLIFLSFSTVVHGYAGLTEGGTLFFVSLLSFFFITNRLLLFIIFCILSILQRELIPLILLIFIFFSKQSHSKLGFLLVSILSFVFYFLTKSVFRIPGNEHQTDLFAVLSNIFTFRVTTDFIFQAILANNIPIFVALISIAFCFKCIKPFIPFIAIFLILILLGIATGIGNNIGRILNMGTPILIIAIAQILQKDKLADYKGF